jgi:hypothetical protein
MKDGMRFAIERESPMRNLLPLNRHGLPRWTGRGAHRPLTNQGDLSAP